MSVVQEIESSVERLSETELSAFRSWFEEFDAKMWDDQLENDIHLGKLEKLANQAITDFESGKCKKL
ncbi:MAG: hypothetical protein V1872_12975 [bacterium]